MEYENQCTKEELTWEKDLAERIAIVEQEQSAKPMTGRDYVGVAILCLICVAVIIWGAFI